MNSDDWKRIIGGGVSAWLDYPGAYPVPGTVPGTWGQPIERVPPQPAGAVDIATGPGGWGADSSRPWLIGGAVLALVALVALVKK